MLKKIVGWPTAYLLYIIGDVVSKVINVVDVYTPEQRLYDLRADLVIDILYPMYRRAVLWSVRINDWAGLSLWKTPFED